MSPSDLVDVMEIERESFGDPWSRDGFAGSMDTPGAFTRCARSVGAGEMLGYVVAWFVADEGQIANVAVRSGSRRNGIGRKLVEAVLDEARRRGVTDIYLEVRNANVAARAMYERLGFRAIGRRRGYYNNPSEDAIVLRWCPASPAVKGS
jgi:ribosomal-protein-alanine N-acetyltransferase